MACNRDDLTQGGILKKLLCVAVPIMGTQLMQMAYNLTDMFWLGRLQDSVMAVAASGLAGMFLWLGMSPMMIGRMGSEIGASQNLGRGDAKTAEAYAEDSTRIALILGLIYGLVLIAFAGPLMSLLMVKEPDVFENACAYLRIVGVGFPPVFVSFAVTGAFTASGRSRLSFWANAAGLALNMALDPLMILSWGWGVAGAAIATVIAQGVVCALLLWFMKRHPHRPFERFRILGRVNGERARQIVRWSLPVALESGAFTVLAMVVTGMVSDWYGENAVAVQRVGSQIESLSWLVGGGFASAITAFMGQNFGARKWARIRRGFRVAMAALLAWEAAVTLLLIFGGRFLFSLFLREPEGILDMGETYLIILAGCQLFMGIEGVSAGTLRGIGKSLPPSISSILSNLIRPLLCWWLAQWMGLDGIWLGVTLSAALRGVLIFAWYLIDERKAPCVDEPEAVSEAAI